MAVFQGYYDLFIKPSPMFHSIGQCNSMNMLEPVTRAAVQALITEAAELDLPVAVIETYRSQELQAIYFEKGATQLKTVGVHHYGMACDLVRMVAGKPNWKVDYTFLGPLAAKHGLIWGGDWGQPGKPHSFKDMDHVQRILVSDQDKLFAGEWWPLDTYLPGLALDYSAPAESEADKLNDAQLVKAKATNKSKAA